MTNKLDKIFKNTLKENENKSIISNKQNKKLSIISRLIQLKLSNKRK